MLLQNYDNIFRKLPRDKQEIVTLWPILRTIETRTKDVFFEREIEQ